MLVVGHDSIVSIKASSWSERLDGLVAKGQWIEALALGLDLHQGAKVTTSLEPC